MDVLSAVPPHLIQRSIGRNASIVDRTRSLSASSTLPKLPLFQQRKPTSERGCVAAKAIPAELPLYYLSRSSELLLGLLPADPWSPNNLDSKSIASQLFAASLFPYLGFLYHITKSKSAPNLTLFGFYFLLVFVGATIPAGIYAKLKYGTSLANVDWLHGSAESMLTLTNLFIVLGLRSALREPVPPGATEDEVEEEKDASLELPE